MPLVLLVSVVTLAIVTTATAALAAQLTRSLDALRVEVSSLAGLRAARDLLAHDLEQARRVFDRPTDRPTDVWPSGPDR